MKESLCNTPVLAYPNFELPFIITTDASQMAVSAVLSQVQDGLERPLVCASRKPNKSERVYTTSELELLSIVWATRYIRCYLYGRKFVIRTGHSVLTYLRNIVDNDSHMMNWSLKLSDLDFEVEHRTGRKIGHVDALSRHVTVIIPEYSLDKENIKREQEKTFCA